MKRNFTSALPAALILLPASMTLVGFQVPASTTAVPAAASQIPKGRPAQATPGQAGQTTAPTAPLTQGGVATQAAKPVVSVTPKVKGKAAPVVKKKPAKPPWLQFPLNKKSTMFLDFTDSNPDMVLSIFARTSGITIVKDPSFKTPLTVASAGAVKLNDAFEILNTVLSLNGYELQKQGKLMVVGKKVAEAPPAPHAAPPQAPPTAPPAPPADDKPVLKVYQLQFANATQVARIVNEVFSQQQLEQIVQQLQNGGGFQGGQPGGFGRPPGVSPPKTVRASSDDYSNAVVVTANKDNQDQVAALIKELDKSADKPLESKIFTLKHVPVEDVLEPIQNVLTSNTPTGRGGGKPVDQNQNQNFFGYYGQRQPAKQASGGESVVAIKQTNSLIVSATKANLDLIGELVKSLDQESEFLGTTSVIHLENAKATDVATLLNSAFTKRRDQNQDNPFFFIYSDNQSDTSKNGPTKDIDEKGQVVNVRDLTGKVNIVADPNTNSLIVVTQPSNLKLIRSVVDQIDRISEQVMIETVIVEANLDKTTKLGVEWSFLQGRVLNNADNSATGKTDFGLQTSTTPLQGFQYTLTGKDYKAFVNALQTDTKFKVLSTPRIFTSNNVKAEINVSQQVPYITNQQTGNIGGLISQYDFKNVGVVLTVTPRITAAGEVSMEVVQSADDLQGFTSFNAPIINHRQASTTASVKDGETIVLGGIIRNTTSYSENKIPLLGDLPLLGNLFKSSSRQRGQTELMVLLTPHIVRSAAEAQRLRDEQTKKLSKGSQDELKRLIPPR